MAISGAATTLLEIQDISIRALIGGTVLLILFIFAANVLNAKKSREILFSGIVAVVAITSGILLASALYIIRNPNINVIEWVL